MKYRPSGETSTSRGWLSKAEAQRYWPVESRSSKRSVCQSSTRAGRAPTSTSATCQRVCPSTSVKLPAATSVAPSGETAIVSTRGVAP